MADMDTKPKCGDGEGSRPAIKVLSLGAGVQSSFLLEASLHGLLPRLTASIFADTGWEPDEVYEQLEYLKVRSAECGVPLHVVKIGDLRSDALRSDALRSDVRGKVTEAGGRWASMPLYTYPREAPRNEDGTGISKYVGMIRRQCTKEYKITPVRQAIRALVLGVSPEAKIAPGTIELWRGISQDEAERASTSEVQYIVHRHPLLTDLDSPTLTAKRLFPVGFTRQDCLDWLKAHGKRTPPRSACKGCPFHDDDEWLRLKANPTDWEDICSFDEAIRSRGATPHMDGDLYLHETCVPLRTARLVASKLPVLGGMRNECAGVCGM